MLSRLGRTSSIPTGFIMLPDLSSQDSIQAARCAVSSETAIILSMPVQKEDSGSFSSDIMPIGEPGENSLKFTQPKTLRGLRW